MRSQAASTALPASCSVVLLILWAGKGCLRWHWQAFQTEDCPLPRPEMAALGRLHRAAWGRKQLPAVNGCQRQLLGAAVRGGSAALLVLDERNDPLRARVPQNAVQRAENLA